MVKILILMNVFDFRCLNNFFNNFKLFFKTTCLLALFRLFTNLQLPTEPFVWTVNGPRLRDTSIPFPSKLGTKATHNVPRLTQNFLLSVSSEAANFALFQLFTFNPPPPPPPPSLHTLLKRKHVRSTHPSLVSCKFSSSSRN